MDLERLRKELIEDEGYRRFPYYDTRSIPTGGIGHNLQAHGFKHGEIETWQKVGIPTDLIEQWFSEDIVEAHKCCKTILPSFECLPDNVQRTLCNMAFDLGYKLASWNHLLAAVERGDWAAAAMSIMNSKFAHQAPNRCARLASRIVAND